MVGGGGNGKMHGMGMSAARQISRRFGRTTRAQTSSGARDWHRVSDAQCQFGGIDWVNRKVYNTPYQMTARTDRSELGRYSPAYATGRSAFVLQSKAEI